MKFSLVVASGPKTGLPISIDADLFMMGSDPVCQLRSPGLGARQCALVSRLERVFIRDFDSGKPTLVNDQVMPSGQEWPLHAGDVIQVGKLKFIAQYDDDTPSESDLEDWHETTLDIEADRGVDDEHGLTPVASASAAARNLIGKLNAIKGEIVGRLRITTDHGVVHVRFTDEVIVDDGEIGHIKNELMTRLQRPNQRILLDFKNVRRMSSAAYTMFAGFSRWIQRRGCRLAFCRVAPELHDMMRSVHLEAIPTFDDRKVAAASSW
jgi:anti-anti-sigma factor